MQRQDLIEKIRKLIEKQQLPKEIKKAVDEIYGEYYNTYEEFLAKVKQLVGNNQELEEIVNYINKDYIEDQGTSYEVEEISYFIKLEQLSKRLKNMINNMLNSKKEGKQKSEDEIIEENIKTDIENKECTEMIILSIISELDSSKKAFITKISNIKNVKNIGAIKQSENKFSEKVEQIINKVRLELAPKIKEMLDAQDVTIGKSVMDLYYQYEKENERQLSNKEIFVSSLQVEVNPQEVLEKLKEEEKQREESESLEKGDLTI